jgi:hypothetical protein
VTGRGRAQVGAAIAAALVAAVAAARVAPALAADPDASLVGEIAYDLKLAPAEVTGEVGAAAAVSLTIAPRAGYRLDRDGPLTIDLAVAPAGGVTLPRRRYQRRHAADVQADAPRFDLETRAKEAGDTTLKVTVRCWICRRTTCWPVREALAIAVHVNAAP